MITLAKHTAKRPRAEFETWSFYGHQVSSEVMDILVRILRQQLAMRLDRVMKFDLRPVAFAPETALLAVRIGQNNDEVVNADQPALDLGPGCGSDGHGDRRHVARSTSPTAR